VYAQYGVDANAGAHRRRQHGAHVADHVFIIYSLLKLTDFVVNVNMDSATQDA
jgi:hypothetical protein